MFHLSVQYNASDVDSREVDAKIIGAVGHDPHSTGCLLATMTRDMAWDFENLKTAVEAKKRIDGIEGVSVQIREAITT